MAGNRKAAEAVILHWIAKIDPSGANNELMQQQFARMNDEQFNEWMETIRRKEDTIAMVAPNLDKGRRMSTANNLAVAPEMGVEFFQQVWKTDPHTGEQWLTPIKYLVCHVPVRRQIQTRENKMAVPKDNSKVDESTGQVTGDSGKSSISSPEMLVLVSSGLYKTVEEFMKVRGGDETALRFSDLSILNTGGVSLNQIGKLGTRAKSTSTFATFLRGMHFDTNYDTP